MLKTLTRTIFAISLGMSSTHLLAAETAMSRDTSKVTQIQEIRNATIKVTYADTTFLIDPMFAAKGFYDGFPDTHRSYLRNPLVELPLKPETILQDVDAVIVTHTHLDHWDDAAQKLIPKRMPIFVQNQADQKPFKPKALKMYVSLHRLLLKVLS